MIFGAKRANGHDYEILPTVPEKELIAFERRNGISLPLDFRTFLEGFGAGGAGPHYGIIDVRKVFSEGDFREPFPMEGDGCPIAFGGDPAWRLPGLAYICDVGSGIEDYIELNGHEPGRIWSALSPEIVRLERFHAYFDKWLSLTELQLERYERLNSIANRLTGPWCARKRLSLDEVAELMRCPYKLSDPSEWRKDRKGEIWARFEYTPGRVILDSKHMMIRVEFP